MPQTTSQVPEPHLAKHQPQSQPQGAEVHLPRRRIRWEVHGEVRDIAAYPGFPPGAADQTLQLKVHIGGASTEIPTRATESVLIAMERANLAPPSQCRSGECGFCRSRLLSGDVYIVPDSDWRRPADRQLGYIHPCSSYPLSDLEIKVPRA